MNKFCAYTNKLSYFPNEIRGFLKFYNQVLQYFIFN